MNFCKTVHNAQFYNSIYDIPEEIWKNLNCTNNLYFDPTYLSSIATHHPDIEFWYIILLDNHQNPIAFATVQIVNFYLDSIKNELQSFVDKIKTIGRKLRILSSEKPLKILTCGNTFVSGEHGIFIKENESKQKVIQELAKSVVHFVNVERQSKHKISGFMLKDFEKESLSSTNELLEYNYHSFNVEPNMVMHIHSDWNHFDDYLAAVKTKFRVKAKKAIERSFTLEEVIIDEHNFDEFSDQIKKLYKNVSSKAGFNLGMFNVLTYKSLKENLKENYIIKGYLLKGRLVGFLSAMINQKSLDAHFVGIDYHLNREYAIYQRMLYDYIKIAIDQKLHQINFGRTASEIKSSVGAIPQDLTIYFRHKNSIPNKILSFFTHKIQPTSFAQKFPFKKVN
ncbi:peptidogalycan biosysnthesis protein [Tenacibaculum sp. M341]|uniref:peptidogalycan biosysnthesis protein n=1 Tax=Tenacibaculum sp. M341 TaxID=2530339 RepID=UPI0010509761|nr:peptidogalycan biosysnthesis protein [Tenacibaculum sp. M341]TCI93092.1 GNAT family N-acetyltransferase [Tenacibaculum sp. M341]